MNADKQAGIQIVLLMLIAPALLLLASGCEKDHMFDFIKSTGKEITLQRTVTGNFNRIQLEDGLDLVITSGTSYNISITGGENLLPGITSEIKDSTLTLRNENKYNWVRSYDKRITAHVSLPVLTYLDYRSTGTVSCTDTIKSDSIFISSYEGSGFINLNINTRLSHLSIITGSVDMNISGFSGVNFIYSGGYGFFNCDHLNTVFTFMQTSSPNDCYINVSHHFEYEILNIGNIYFRGNPDIIKGHATGGGTIIPIAP